MSETPKLLAHMERMQSRAAAFIEPGPYTDIGGLVSTSDNHETTLFANDMIYLLDGPEQREAEAEARFDYLAESARTVSGEYFGHNVTMSNLMSAFSAFTAAANNLDRIKKLLFYGERPEKGIVKDSFEIGHNANMAALKVYVGMGGTGPTPEHDTVEDKDALRRAQDVIHAVLGSATETGEMVEALQRTILYNERLDMTNLLEEVFDDQWYHALLCRVAGVTFAEGQRNNIDKLKERFPLKFLVEAAHERNLDAERAVLEGMTHPDKAEPRAPYEAPTFTPLSNEEGDRIFDPRRYEK